MGFLGTKSTKWQIRSPRDAGSEKDCVVQGMRTRWWISPSLKMAGSVEDCVFKEWWQIRPLLTLRWTENREREQRGKQIKRATEPLQWQNLPLPSNNNEKATGAKQKDTLIPKAAKCPSSCLLHTSWQSHSPSSSISVDNGGWSLGSGRN